MQQDKYIIDCLFFLVYPEKTPDPGYAVPSSVDLSTVSRYVLLPEIAVEFRDKIIDFFASNDIEIIRSREDCTDELTSSIRSCKVEILYIHLSLALSSSNFVVQGEVKCDHILSTWFSEVERLDRSIQCERSVFQETVSLETIFHLVKFNPKISYRGPDGSTILHLAVLQECEPLVRFLLINGANANDRNPRDKTALHLACFDYPSYSIAKLLIEHGADTNATTVLGTPLFYCMVHCDVEHIDIMKCLLDNGANVDVLDKMGMSALELAFFSGPEVLACVLDHQPKLNNSFNKSIFRKLLTKLVHNMSLPHPKERIYRFNSCIDQLLAYGFDIDEKTAKDMKMFFKAIKLDNLEMVTRMLRSGSSPTDLFEDMTALHAAAMYSSDSMIRVLLGFGADMNAKTSMGKTALSLAAKCGNIEVVKCLLARGAKLVEHRSLLHDLVSMPYDAFPSTRKMTEIVNMLIKSGADVNAVDDKGKTPITLASSSDRGDVVEILIRNGACFDYDGELTLRNFYEAIESRHLKTVFAYLRNGVDARSDMKEVLSRAFTAGTRGYKYDFEGNIIDSAGYEDMLKFFLLFYDSCADSLEEVASLDQSICNESICRDLLKHGFMSLVQIFASENVKKYILRVVDYYENTITFDYKLGKDILNCEIFCQSLIVLFHADLSINDDINSPDSQIASILHRLSSCADELSRACKAEIPKLKNKIIGSSYISYYDILDATFPQIVRLLRNENIAETLKSESFETFPIYGDMISKRVQRALFRNVLLADGIKIFNILFASNPNLPFAVKEKIVSYLNNQQLFVLINACHFPSSAMSTSFSDFLRG